MDNSLVENALYVVSTPIGNLNDLTFRALEVLKNVDIVACEDTRNSGVLFDKYSISTKLVSYHKFNEQEKKDYFLNLLKEGKSIALISDAGTPLISDPGNILVDLIKKEGFRVIPVPGCCAIITLLSSISRKGEDFKFIGFIERSEKQIIEIISKNNSENLIFYESPNRLITTLKIIATKFPNKQISIGRELTKKFEEIISDNIKNVIEYFENNVLKGELVVLLHKTEMNEEINIEEKIKILKSLKLKNALSDKDISLILSNLYDVNKNDVYKKCL